MSESVEEKKEIHFEEEEDDEQFEDAEYGGIEHGDEEEEEEEEHNHRSAFSSIWDMVDTMIQSPFDELFEKGNVKLEDVLEEEHLIQEVKSQNSQLIDFLSKKENMSKMIEYLTVVSEIENNEQAEITGDEQEEELKKKQEYHNTFFKYPYITSEIIMCDVDDLNQVIANDEELLLQLFSFLENRKKKSDKQLNSSHAAYFVKVMNTLLQKFYPQIVDVILKKEEIFNNLIENIGAFELNNLILKILGLSSEHEGFDDFTSFTNQQKLRELFFMKNSTEDKELQEKKLNVQKYFVEMQFIPKLLKQLTIDDTEIHQNVFSLLTEIISVGDNPVATEIYKKEVLENILDMVLKNPSLYIESIPFLETLITKSTGNKDEQKTDDMSTPIAILQTRIKDIINLLNEKPNEKVQTAYQLLDPPLGEIRLKTVQLIANIMKTNYAPIQQELMKNDALKMCIDLFFDYKYNNLLHYYVTDMVISAITNENNLDVVKHIIVDCKLIDRMLNAEKIVTSDQKEILETQYMGHIFDIATKILNCIEKEEEKYKYLSKLMTDVKGWDEFTNGYLAEKTKLHNKQLGGPVPIGSSVVFQFDDDDEEEGDFELNEDSDSDDSDEEVVVRNVDNEEEKEEEKQIDIEEVTPEIQDIPEQKTEEKQIEEKQTEEKQTEEQEDWANFDEAQFE